MVGRRAVLIPEVFVIHIYSLLLAAGVPVPKQLKKLSQKDKVRWRK